MSDELQAAVRELPDATVIDLQGDVTSFADARLHTSFATASARGLHFIVLNFAGVEYINSAGIATIISILAEARGRDQQLLIVGLSEHYRKIFRMVGVARYAEIFESEEDALAKVATTPISPVQAEP
ncbi:MAG TPA: STAS domain-containing protein [Chloroflexia bacterium]|nr:STAS domain-containing protein [Chloroflexia bacterium]